MPTPWLGGETRRIYAVLIGGLVIWAAVHAVGAAINGQKPWAGAVVAASFVLYLSVWMVLLSLRNRRLARLNAPPKDEKKSGGHAA